MSAAATDVFERDLYRAPEAQLLESNAVVFEDKLFSLQGRIGVLTFNARYLVCMLAMIVCFVPMFFVMLANGDANPAGLSIAIAGLLAVLAVVPGYVMIVSTIKRLHDLNHSGWFMLVGMIPILGAIWTLYYSFFPARDADNRYGATAETATWETYAGVIGIAAIALLTVAALIGNFMG